MLRWFGPQVVWSGLPADQTKLPRHTGDSSRGYLQGRTSIHDPFSNTLIRAQEESEVGGGYQPGNRFVSRRACMRGEDVR